VLLAAVLGSLPGTARAVFTEVHSLEIETQSGLFGTCDTGVGIGGGVEGVEPTWTVHSSYVSTLSSGYWTGFVQNLGAPSTVKTAAVCANGNGWPGFEVVGDDYQIPAGGVAGDSVLCPLGTIALGGGASFGGALGAGTIVATAPYFPASPLAPRLHQQEDGERGPPGGWWSSYRSGAGVLAGAVVATCGAADDAVTVVNSNTVDAGEVAAASARCPTGTIAIGGGVDAADPTGLRLASSAPLFFGFPLATRLANVADGVAGAPVGWRASLRNDGATSQLFQVAAVCVPESGGAPLAAVLALGALARRRCQARSGRYSGWADSHDESARIDSSFLRLMKR
jgi:hypothetical protein